MTILEVIFMLIVGGIASTLGWIISAKYQKSKLSAASATAKTIIENSKREAEQIKKEALLEAKDQAYKIKQEAEKQINEKSKNIQARESSLNQRELGIERKADLIEKREAELHVRDEDINERMRVLHTKDEHYNKLIEEQNIQLEKIASMSQEEARSTLVDNLVDKAKQDAARKIKEIKDEAIRTANAESLKIVVSAIQRSAADHSAETTVSVVNLPSDAMKGRIIGREGRNIRSFESLTGVEVIIDDTPEAVVISGFDPVRREVARLALEHLVADGRIHPARIEDVVEKVEGEVSESMKQAAEDTILELGIPRFPNEIMQLLGKMRYRTSYGQNVLKHSIEVGSLSGLMAAELSLDGDIAKISGLLHDIGKTVDKETSGPHALLGGEVLRKYIDNEIIINAVESHHEDIEMTNPISALVQAADAISGARRGARGDTLEAYIRRMENLEEIAVSFKGVSKTYAIQAGREIRVMVENEQIDDIAADRLADDIAEKIQSELTYPGQIKVVVIREHRGISVAK